MNTTGALIPLRVPELGPSLGKLVAGTERPTRRIPLDAIRYRLATRIIEQAGESRRLAANDDRSSALAALSRATWWEAWDEAVVTVTDTLADKVSAQLDAEARAVKMGERRRAKLQLDEAAKRTIAARLGATGAALVPVLDAIDQTAAALEGTHREHDAVEQWQEGQKLAARRLEAAWFALEQSVEKEATRWLDVMDEVARWRKPFWPVAVVAILALGLAVWLGLIFGGYIDAPGWLARIWSQVLQR